MSKKQVRQIERLTLETARARAAARIATEILESRDAAATPAPAAVPPPPPPAKVPTLREQLGACKTEGERVAFVLGHQAELVYGRGLTNSNPWDSAEWPTPPEAA